MLSQPSDGTHMALIYTPDLYLYESFGIKVSVDDLVFPYMFSYTPIVVATKSQHKTFDMYLNYAAEWNNASLRDSHHEPIKMCTSRHFFPGHLLHKVIQKTDDRAKYIELVECDDPYEDVANTTEGIAEAGYIGLPTAIDKAQNNIGGANFVAVSGKYPIVDLPDTSLLSYLGFLNTELTSLRGFAVNKNVSVKIVTDLAARLHKAHQVKIKNK